MKCWLPFLAVLIAASYVQADPYRIVCYYGSWAVYRPGDGKFDVENIDPTLCTHLVYTFVGVGYDGGVSILDSWNEVDKGALKRFNDLRQLSPSTKTMVAIGGWNAGSYSFSQVVNSDSMRAKFVDSIVSFVKQWGFDGFDLDWEYPTLRGGAPEDKEGFAKLLRELRPKMDENGYILSAAVSAGIATIDPAYDVPALAEYLHFINVMSYDLHGSWETVTGENAPLYPGSTDTTESARTLNVDTAIKYWISKGAPASKLNVGMGTYGRSFTLASTSNTGVGAPTTGPGQAGPYTREGGTLGYNEICVNNWPEHWNEEQQVPYAVSGNQWVGYDNVKSIQIKSQYVKDNGLGGAMIWSVETDDFLGKCGQGKNPLLNTIKSTLNGDGPQPDTTTDSGETKPTDPNPDTTTTSTTTTTTTTTVGPPPSGICTTTGYVRDPDNCQIFYYCSVVDGHYEVTQFSCGAGTVFDPSINGCNFASEVQC
ncbi:hypothetical protein ANN_09152 [Periplaneta americana]|uniref:Chitinase n=1 Tax=Periplaneta americana TaxID=6978 RepID=A0ABQ8TMM3_PERAM|nr:hypothetical protein ANN_09152 [Periplaneta americana]